MYVRTYTRTYILTYVFLVNPLGEFAGSGSGSTLSYATGAKSEEDDILEQSAVQLFSIVNAAASRLSRNSSGSTCRNSSKSG